MKCLVTGLRVRKADDDNGYWLEYERITLLGRRWRPVGYRIYKWSDDIAKTFTPYRWPTKESATDACNKLRYFAVLHKNWLDPHRYAETVAEVRL